MLVATSLRTRSVDGKVEITIDAMNPAQSGMFMTYISTRLSPQDTRELASLLRYLADRADKTEDTK